MSLLIIPVYIVYSIRRVINVLPFYVIPVLWTFGMMVFWSFYQDILLDPSNLTFLHRFGSYVSLWNLDVNELFFGVDNIAKISSFVAHTMSYDYEYFGGFGGWLIMNGLLSAVLYFLILHRLHITSVGVLLFLLLSVNVQVDTNQNFIILAYFILFKYCRSGANDKTFNVLKN